LPYYTIIFVGTQIQLAIYHPLSFFSGIDICLTVIIHILHWNHHVPSCHIKTFFRMLALVWFALFIHPFSHICNIGHVNYRLQFTTQLI